MTDRPRPAPAALRAPRFTGRGDALASHPVLATVLGATAVLGVMGLLRLIEDVPPLPVWLAWGATLAALWAGGAVVLRTTRANLAAWIVSTAVVVGPAVLCLVVGDASAPAAPWLGISPAVVTGLLGPAAGSGAALAVVAAAVALAVRPMLGAAAEGMDLAGAVQVGTLAVASWVLAAEAHSRVVRGERTRRKALQDLSDRLPIGVVTLRSGRIETLNSLAADLVGSPSEALRGSFLEGHLDSQDRGTLDEHDTGRARPIRLLSQVAGAREVELLTHRVDLGDGEVRLAVLVERTLLRRLTRERDALRERLDTLGRMEAGLGLAAELSRILRQGLPPVAQRLAELRRTLAPGGLGTEIGDVAQAVDRLAATARRLGRAVAEHQELVDPIAALQVDHGATVEGAAPGLRTLADRAGLGRTLGALVSAAAGGTITAVVAPDPRPGLRRTGVLFQAEARGDAQAPSEAEELGGHWSNQGGQVRLWLPVWLDDPPETAPGAGGPGTGSARVLLAGDDALVLRELARGLERRGLAVHVTDLAALQALPGNPEAVVVWSRATPDIGTLETLRRRPQGGTRACVLCVPLLDSTARDAARHAGWTQVLEVPCSPQQIADTLEGLAPTRP